MRQEESDIEYTVVLEPGEQEQDYLVFEAVANFSLVQWPKRGIAESVCPQPELEPEAGSPVEQKQLEGQVMQRQQCHFVAAVPAQPAVEVLDLVVP